MLFPPDIVAILFLGTVYYINNLNMHVCRVYRLLQRNHLMHFGVIPENVSVEVPVMVNKRLVPLPSMIVSTVLSIAVMVKFLLSIVIPVFPVPE